MDGNQYNSEDDLSSLVKQKRRENLQLEYKRANKLYHVTNLVARDVTAMANATGGIIIYGIAEDEENKIPVELDPVEFTRCSKETIEQLIIDNSDPRFTDFTIIEVEAKDKIDHGYYVIVINQSTTAHQFTVDNKYYIRRNFKAEPMLDYEVEDIKRRNKFPDFDVKIGLDRCEYLVGFGTKIGVGMPITITNVSAVYAKYVVMKVSFPYFHGLGNDRHELILFNTDKNTYSHIRKGDYKTFENPIPILPECSHSWFIPLADQFPTQTETLLRLFSEMNHHQMVNWKLYADNAKPRENEIWLGELVKNYLSIFD